MAEGPRWLLLIHQLPQRPAYLRVKIARRTARLGALPVKNSVYVLPRREETLREFRAVLKEIVRGGGEASLAEAAWLEGIRDRDLEDSFNRLRNAEYRKIALLARRGGNPARLRKRLAEVVAIDFFQSPGRAAAEAALARGASPGSAASLHPADYRRRTWVTRQGIGIDRMACAWLIRRFIDPAARFKFVPAKGYTPLPREIRFDMTEGEFTHEGSNCTFEVLLDRMGLDDPALRPIAELVHDSDLQDNRFRRSETRGLELVVDGIRHSHEADEDRLVRARQVFEDLYALFRRKR